jgi:hypothetical protein
LFKKFDHFVHEIRSARSIRRRPARIALTLSPALAHTTRTAQRTRGTMTNIRGSSSARRRAVWAVALVSMVGMAACGQLMTMMHGGPARPAESEFGLGPKQTAAGLYRVTLEPAEPLATRKLQRVQVRVVDTTGRAVDGAEVTVDGGMPQHGHGLPTRPRVTGQVGAGLYEIDGVRFNMGGWWVFRLAIAAAAGTDSVTFNIDL